MVNVRTARAMIWEGVQTVELVPWETSVIHKFARTKSTAPPVSRSALGIIVRITLATDNPENAHRDAKNGTTVITAQSNAFATELVHSVAAKMVFVSVNQATPVWIAVSDARMDARTISVTSQGSVPLVVLLGDTGHSVMEGAVTVLMNRATLLQGIVR